MARELLGKLRENATTRIGFWGGHGLKAHRPALPADATFADLTQPMVH